MDRRPPEALLKALGFREEARGANLWLVIPNDQGVFDGADDISKAAYCVHPVQAYVESKVSARARRGSRYRASLTPSPVGDLMPTKPRTAAGYEPAQVAHVRATCLYVATKLGDLVDELVIVGGLVPSLIVDQAVAHTKHVGTADLDVGLALAVFDSKRYQVLTERLRQAGFAPDANERGNLTRQRWVVDGPPRVAVDFLVAPTDPTERGAGSRASSRTSPRSSRRGFAWLSRIGSA